MSQYTDNNFYGGAGGSGGGFLTGGSPYGTGSPGGFGRRNEVSQSLRPVTIHQVLSASQAHSDAEWMLDEQEIGQVTVVAQVVTINSQATNNLYWLDDGTGRIEARHWTDSSLEASDKQGGVTEGTYVRVLGNLKVFGAKRYINATHIRSVQCPNEIYFHLLETMTVTLIWERGPPSGSGPAQRQPNAATSGGGAATYSQSHVPAIDDQYSHLPALQRSIVQFILSQPPSAEGVHVSAIARNVGGGSDAMAISDALDKLMDEGHLYSTVDSSHYNVAN